MSNAYSELAKLFSERDNKARIGIIVATVSSINALPDENVGYIKSIDIGNGIIIDNFIRTSLSSQPIFYEGNKIIVIASENNNTFFIIDKVV